ncbi:DUF6265 family protein [Emticicia sp. BO119]|uniref:DUF6265 family protein n=1 Tax=Emticicia sp. BO119 TaxID=2757768 RepID=UPI0015F042EF|nr:DUF6265 family protein [Emticicia sp. BO119]MBA4850918.1 hypothetical protein [Emticicia sp. BO119]
MKKSIHTISLLALFFNCLIFSKNTQAQSKANLNDVSFMHGHWQGTFNGGPIEAFWAKPSGDNLTGFMRMMKDDKVTMYEMLIFEQTDKGPIVLVKHFKPGLIGVEDKEVSDRYNFIESKKEWALFEKQDGSIRIIYEKRGADVLVIQRGKQENGKWVFADLFVFNSVK